MAKHPDGFECQQCGVCCHTFVVVTDEEILRWAVAFRDDIMRHISTEEHFILPVTNKERDMRCPFLVQIASEQYVCRIYDERPEACRLFPKSFEQIQRHNCIGIKKAPKGIEIP